MSQRPAGFNLQGQAPPQPYPGYPPPQQQYPPAPNPYTPQQQASFGHQPFPAPIQQQPFSSPVPVGNWAASMPFEQILAQTDVLIVKQKIEVLEMVTNFETKNKYSIKDASGNKLFEAVEESDCLTRNLCGKYRAFRLGIRDLRHVEIMHIERGVDCSCCCGLLCPDEIQVKLSASQQLLGTVKQNFSCFPSYSLLNAAGQHVLGLDGPLFATSLCPGMDVEFNLHSANGTRVGQVSKVWGGIGRELFTDADTFKVTFPRDLDLSMKMVCLGCLFLIDYAYFERSGNRS